MTMEFDKNAFQKAAVLGSAEASASFSKLSGQKVVVSVSEVDYLTPQEINERLSQYSSSRPIIAYAQMITGVDGVSVLTMTREEALILIDLLNKKPLGTTGVLMDIDRSAIKETLNIISNSFLTSLAKRAGQTLIIGDPRLITAIDIHSIFSKLAEGDERVIRFRTVLQIAEFAVMAELHMIFHRQLKEVLKHINN